jgi:hypothetical protein
VTQACTHLLSKIMQEKVYAVREEAVNLAAVVLRHSTHTEIEAVIESMLGLQWQAKKHAAVLARKLVEEGRRDLAGLLARAEKG